MSGDAGAGTPGSDAKSIDLMDAAHFAATMHADQRRRGARSLPYVNHVLDVARRLSAAHPGDPVLIAGGLLHDVIEDCTDWSRSDPATTPEAMGRTLAQRFGAEVEALVWEVTDDKTLDKLRRKDLQVEKTPGRTLRAQRLKLADLASNLTELPPDWPRLRRTEYLDWARRVAGGARGASDRLAAEFDDAARRMDATIGESA